MSLKPVYRAVIRKQIAEDLASNNLKEHYELNQSKIIIECKDGEENCQQQEGEGGERECEEARDICGKEKCQDICQRKLPISPEIPKLPHIPITGDPIDPIDQLPESTDLD